MPDNVTLYIKSGCTACRKVQDVLSKREITVAVREFFRQPMSEGELRRLIGDRPVAEAFSWRSPSVKKLGLDAAAVRASDDEMVRLMLQEPRLIRRPILVAGETVVFGATSAEAAGALG